MKCFCGERDMDIEKATYAINGVPCHDRGCYEDALEAQGVKPGYVVPVTYRRPKEVDGFIF